MKTLETERLILEPWNEDFAADMFDYAKLEQVGPAAGWPPHRSIDDSREVIKIFLRDDDVWALRFKADNKIIGSLGLHLREPYPAYAGRKQREIGYVLHPTYWGQGLVPEAVERVIDHGFSELELELLWCACSEDNTNSLRVIEKCGFEYSFSQKTTRPLLGDKPVTVKYHIRLNHT